MNHIFRTLWNKKTGTFVAVSELTRSKGKKASAVCGDVTDTRAGLTLKTMTTALLMAFGAPLYALPGGGEVVAGSATISSNPGNMTINQGSQNAALNWQSFSIGQGEAVQFVQPNSSSVALNRVLGADPSSILGSLSANGQVFLVNPNGVLFGQGASVNVGGLVASTLNISDSDFMAGEYKFAGSSAAAVLNQGEINADGGYVALLGANVSNQGVIAARLGTVALAAGETITLDVAGDGLLNVGIDQGAVDALVANGGLIQADGGQVLMSAQAAGNLLNTAVNNTGVIQAQTIENRDGVIRLLGDMQTGTVDVAGILDASAPTGGDGGFIDTSAAHVKIDDAVNVTTVAASGKTGTWLIDPVDFTIAASGGDITGATLSSNLGSTDVIIESVNGGAGTSGDVNVNDTVSWSANKLTLNAQNDININTEMNASGSASLALEYGQGAVAAGNTSTVSVNAPVNLPAGDNLSKKLGSDGATVTYTVITSLGEAGSTTGTDLQGMNGDLAGHYALGADIDAIATSGWNAGAGFMPVGSYDTRFGGAFDGMGHTISNLTINRPFANYVGLLGYVDRDRTISNVGLAGVSVTGQYYVGGLIGYSSFYTAVNNSYSSGGVTGAISVGGLMGYGDYFNEINNSYSTASVTGTGNGLNLGGLAGHTLGTISNSYATGNVSGTQAVGGLVGHNQSNTLSNSYATGTVSGTSRVGGLAGYNNATISNSYATGNVTGASQVGGVVGEINNGSLTNSYATGMVSGSNQVGALVGYKLGTGTVSNGYWNSTVNPGLAGIGAGTLSGTTGLTNTQMQTASNFAGFNFTTTPGATGNNWVMVNVDGTLNNAGGVLGGTRPMLASEYSTTINNAHQLQLMSMDLDANYTLGRNIDAAATGTAADVWLGSTFIPVGNSGTTFSGALNGQGNTISNLTVNLPSADHIGLIGMSFGASILDVGLVNADITGREYVGGLVGHSTLGSLANNFSTDGQVDGTDSVGGLVGYANTTSIAGNYSSNTVSGINSVGGLLGRTNGGMNSDRNYASGNVTGAGNSVGGLVGENGFAFSIGNSYATGNVSGADGVGGLVGFNNSGSVTNTYSSGAVSGSTNVGGLVGGSNSTVSNSYWDIDSSGQASSAGGIGLTTTQMRSQTNFTTWDMANTWVQYDTYTAPLLRSFMSLLTVTVNSNTKTFDGEAYLGGNGVTYSTTPNGDLFGTLSYGGTSQGARNAGAYAITGSGLYSNQQGYIINYTGGSLTVNPAALTVSASNVSKTYDGGTTAAGTATVSSGTLFGTDAISGGNFTFTDKNVGTGNKTVTTSGVTLIDGNGGGNYAVSYADNTTSTISPYAVSLSGSRVYDGTADIASGALTIGSLVGSETLNLTGSGTVGDKHVANGKAVALGSLAMADGTDGGLAGNYSFTGGTQAVDITPAALTLSSSDVIKTYDGDTTAAGSATVIAGKLFDTDAIAGGSFGFTDPNVGIGNKTVSIRGVTVSDGNDGGNYSVTYADNTSSSITADSLLQNARATATLSEASASEVSSGWNQAPPTPPPADSSAMNSLAGLDMVVVNEGIRLAPDMAPGVRSDDDAN